MQLDHEQFMQQAPDAMIVADHAGTIRYWNPAAERIFGFPAEEAVGVSLDLIIPDQFRAAHWRGFEQAMASGQTKYHGQALPTKALHRDGRTIYVELSFSIVLRDGVPDAAMACARDITARFERDREDRRRLRSLEAEIEQIRGHAEATRASGADR